MRPASGTERDEHHSRAIASREQRGPRRLAGNCEKANGARQRPARRRGTAVMGTTSVRFVRTERSIFRERVELDFTCGEDGRFGCMTRPQLVFGRSNRGENRARTSHGVMGKEGRSRIILRTIGPKFTDPPGRLTVQSEVKDLSIHQYNMSTSVPHSLAIDRPLLAFHVVLSGPSVSPTEDSHSTHEDRWLNRVTTSCKGHRWDDKPRRVTRTTRSEKFTEIRYTWGTSPSTTLPREANRRHE